MVVVVVAGWMVALDGNILGQECPVGSVQIFISICLAEIGADLVYPSPIFLDQNDPILVNVKKCGFETK